jgi:restriction endonuclease S subunit
MQAEIYACARGHAQKNIDLDAFRTLRIPLPPLDVQKEIVAEIEGYQKVIDGARAIIDNYRPKIPIDPEWQIVELGEVIDELESGVSVNSTNRKADMGELGILKTSCVTSGIFDPAENKAVLPEEQPRLRCSVRAGSIIISRMNTEALVGASAFVPKDYPCLFLPDRLWQTVISREDVEARYLQTVLSSAEYRAKISALCGGTSGSMKNISKSNLLSLRVPLPSIGIQRAIAAEIETEQALVNANRELIARMEKKIQATLARVWGATPESAAETAGSHNRPSAGRSSRPERVEALP